MNLKQIELEGTNVVVLQYEIDKLNGIKEVVYAAKQLQNKLGEGKVVVPILDKVNIRQFDFQGFLDYIGDRFNVDIMFKERK